MNRILGKNIYIYKSSFITIYNLIDLDNFLYIYFKIIMDNNYKIIILDKNNL